MVPGHGDPAGLGFVQSSLEAFRSVASLAGRIHAGELDLEAAIALAPYPPGPSREPLERAVAQLRGELDGPSAGTSSWRLPPGLAVRL